MEAIIGDITKVRDVDAIVNAANGLGVMGAGVAGAIARSMGTKAASDVREFCKKTGPYGSGTAYSTDAGLLKRIGVKKIYHAVTMTYPGQRSKLEYVENSLRSVVSLAIQDEMKSIAIPGLGIGIGGLNKKIVASRMVSILRPFENRIQVKIVDRGEDFIEAIRAQL